MTDTNIANQNHEPLDIPESAPQMPPCHMWVLGRFFACDQDGEPPAGHRWISWERDKGDLLIYIGRRWWIEWSARRRR